MRKIVLSLLAVSMFSFTSAAQTTRQWKTVQIVTITGNTNVSNATLFTPATGTAYRLSASLTQGYTSSESIWIAGFHWSDQLGSGGLAAIKVVSTTVNWNSTVFMFNPVAGKPVTYSLEEDELTYAPYRLQIVVEKLE
jgi:hypothetical protein